MAQYKPKVLIGRTRNATEPGGYRAHAVAEDSWFAKALCGAQPGRRSNGWSEWTPSAITCPKCLAKLAKENK